MVEVLIHQTLKKYLNTNNVDGVLVGGASTKIDQLLGIVNSI